MTEDALFLSRYLRLFRLDGQQFVEAILTEQYAPLDYLLQRVIEQLAGAPVTRTGLLAALARDAAVDDPPAVAQRLRTLQLIGLLMPWPDADRDRVFPSTAADHPIVDQVELTSVCPMRCLMCPRGVDRVTRPNGHMERALFESLLAQLDPAHQLKPLTLHNLGESILHPELDAFIGLASRAGLATELSVNPGLLSLARYQSLVAAGLSRLVLPVDGLDAATLEAIRGPAVRAAHALANLDAILEHRRAQPAAGPEILIQMIRMAINRHQHAQFVARYGQLGLPRVVGFIKELDAATPPPGDQQFVARARPFVCRAPWLSVVVLWDGRVVPCCYDDDARLVLGDLRRQSLIEIWRGPAVQRLRQQLRAGAIAPGHLCASCPHRADRYQRPPLDEIPDEPLHW